MSTGINKLHKPKHNSHFRLWSDRVDFRGDEMNISDRILRDIGLMRRDPIRSLGRYWFT
jgi:uncharacterized protein YjiS (DUF1127 family)